MNVERARAAGRNVREAGFVPIVPHLLVLNDDPEKFTYEKAMAECLAILERCDAVFMVEGWTGSPGANVERRLALRMRIPICHNLSELAVAMNRYPVTREA